MSNHKSVFDTTKTTIKITLVIAGILRNSVAIKTMIEINTGMISVNKISSPCANATVGRINKFINTTNLKFCIKQDKNLLTYLAKSDFNQIKFVSTEIFYKK